MTVSSSIHFIHSEPTMRHKTGRKLLPKNRKISSKAVRQKSTSKTQSVVGSVGKNENKKDIIKSNNDINLTGSQSDTIIQRQKEIFNKSFSSDINTLNNSNATFKRKRGRPKTTVIDSDSFYVSEGEIDEEVAETKDKENSATTKGKRKAEESPERHNSKVLKKSKVTSSGSGNEKLKKKIKEVQDKNSLPYIAFEAKKDGDGSKTKIFKCKICNKVSSAKADLLKHIRIHTGERPYKCKFCDAAFVQVTALRGHETIHTGQKNFICDVCGKKFAIKDRLRLHMRIHTGEKPHQCKQCDLTFARKSQVSQHMRSHETSKDKFTCDECGLTFASYHTLKAHTNSHLGIKEFQCCACGKKFLRIEGMHKHIRTVHRGSRPYTCNICGKAFKGHLQQHMRLHRGVRPYTCHLCDAAFTQNSQLTVHLRIHTGERPYKCQVCASSFAHSSACKIHMRSHTGEKPFKCVVCTNAFSQLPHLKKHMKCVHGADKPYMCTLCQDFFKTQAEIDNHRRFVHNIIKSAEEEAQESVEEATLARLRNRLAVLLYRISSEDRRAKFGFGTQLIDEVLKLSLKSSGHTPVSDPSLARLEELRQNVLTLLRWTIPQETMEEYHKNKMTVDEVLDMLTS